MIFVTIGTGEFERLIKEADELSKKIKEEIIIQKGNSKYIPKNTEYFEFTEDFDKYVKKSKIILSHGGAGTIFELLNKNKKIIAVANFKRTDKHQKEILEELDKDGYLIYCENFDLHSALKKAEKFRFKKYTKPECWIDREIINFLD